MPPRYVKPYVKRNKNDAADAEAICEAVQRPTMRFVPIKSPEQQSVLMLHRTRQVFIRQRTALINAIHWRINNCRVRCSISTDCCSGLLIGTKRIAVSYTHLRAHETDSYLVCRLL